MKNFNQLFEANAIIFYLCKLRAKVAKQRSKFDLYHRLTSDPNYNYHKTQDDKLSEYQKKFISELNSILPPRKKWIELDEKSRFNKNHLGNKVKVNSFDKNLYSLFKTTIYYRSKKPNEPFIIRLNQFISDVQLAINDIDYRFTNPVVIPKPKKLKLLHELSENEKNTCRPISLFCLKDRIILSFTNNFLTRAFDSCFLDCSLAFRAPQKNGVITHHDAITRILEYKKLYNNVPLWVGECDMQKFYDTVNHKTILWRFKKLSKKVKGKYPELDLESAIRIFKKYLDCYSFNNDVLPLNLYPQFWDKHKIPKGEFGWVEKELRSLNYYNSVPKCLRWLDKGNILKSYFEKNCFNISSERIGIPQGGALSGFIANVVLDYTDRKTLSNSDLRYTRFCDDMILMHFNKKKCQRGLSRYQKSLKKLKLVPHPFSTILTGNRIKAKPHLPEISLAAFWKEKSKGPYMWASLKDGGFPWLGFVGYEVNYEGLTRVRKSSIEKEYKKQIKIIDNLKKVITTGKRVNNNSIKESAIHQLIGMSVGRVELWNYAEMDNEMCWKNGFKALEPNKYSIKQLKFLDRSRNKLYYDLKKYLDISYTDTKPAIKKNKKRELIWFNKPFSYYYHFVEKPKQ